MHRKGNIVKNLDWFTVLMYVVLLTLGWLNIYSASYNIDHPSIFDTTQEYGKQFIWIITACILAFVIMLFDGDFIKRTSPLVYGLTSFLLVLVLIFGREINGQKAWFGFGSFGIQPSEFSKLGISLMLAHYLSGVNIRIQQMNSKLIATAIIAVPAGLIMLQPDTGTVLVFAAFILVLYREGLSGNILLLGLLSGVIAVLSLIMRATEIDIWGWAVEGHYMLMAVIAVLTALIYLGIKRFVLPRYRKRNILLLLGAAVGSLIFIATLDQIFENVLEHHQKTRINILLGLDQD